MWATLGSTVIGYISNLNVRPCGSLWYAQGIQLDPTASAGIAFTAALHMRLGQIDRPRGPSRITA